MRSVKFEVQSLKLEILIENFSGKTSIGLHIECESMIRGVFE